MVGEELVNMSFALKCERLNLHLGDYVDVKDIGYYYLLDSPTIVQKSTKKNGNTL